MSTYPAEMIPPQHNHLTRDVKPFGECPACDLNYRVNENKDRIRKMLSACPSCGRPRGSTPGAMCANPSDHRGRPQNHGGVGKPLT